MMLDVMNCTVLLPSIYLQLVGGPAPRFDEKVLVAMFVYMEASFTWVMQLDQFYPLASQPRGLLPLLVQVAIGLGRRLFSVFWRDLRTAQRTMKPND